MNGFHLVPVIQYYITASFFSGIVGLDFYFKFFKNNRYPILTGQWPLSNLHQESQQYVHHKQFAIYPYGYCSPGCMTGQTHLYLMSHIVRMLRCQSRWCQRKSGSYLFVSLFHMIASAVQSQDTIKIYATYYNQ